MKAREIVDAAAAVADIDMKSSLAPPQSEFARATIINEVRDVNEILN